MECPIHRPTFRTPFHSKSTLGFPRTWPSSGPSPPLIPFLSHVSRAALGDSLRAIRFIPALASSLLVVQTALIAREFGGRRFALLLSAIAVVIAPQYLSNGSLLTTNCLEPNLWMGCAYFVILAIKRDQ